MAYITITSKIRALGLCSTTCRSDADWIIFEAPSLHHTKESHNKVIAILCRLSTVKLMFKRGDVRDLKSVDNFSM